MRARLLILAASSSLAVTIAVPPATVAANKPALNPALQKCVQDESKKDQDAAIADCTATIVSGKLNRIEMFNAYAARATAYWAKKNFDAMLADTTAIVSIAPNNREGFLLRGVAYEYLGKPAQAIAQYTKAIAIDKKYLEAYMLRGVLYADAGKNPEARNDFETCLKLDPKQQNCQSSLDAVNGMEAQNQSPTPPASASSGSAGPAWSGPAYYLVMNFSSGLKPFNYGGPYSGQADCEAARAKYRGDGDGEACEYLATDPDAGGK